MSLSTTWRGLLLTAALAVVWLGILPRVATWSSVQQRRARHEESGINPGAIFYSEQPDDLFDRADVALHEHPEAFW